MKKNKKAFTLVELLVVIAILAILATVSILGYTSFTAKAKQSVSDDELLQIKTVFLADWLDGFIGEPEAKQAMKKVSDGYEFTVTIDASNVVKENETYKADKTAEKVKEAAETLLESALGTEYADYKTKVSFDFADPVDASTGDKPDHLTWTVKVTKVKYDNQNGYQSQWTIGTDKIGAQN